MYGIAFFQLDAFSTPKLKKNNENMKTEWLAMCSEIDELRAKYITIEERFATARKDHCRALDQLREDRKNVPSVFVFPFVFWLVTAKTRRDAIRKHQHQRELRRSKILHYSPIHIFRITRFDVEPERM